MVVGYMVLMQEDQGIIWICLKQTLNICSNFLQVDTTLYYIIDFFHINAEECETMYSKMYVFLYSKTRYIQLFIHLVKKDIINFHFSGLVDEHLFISIKIVLKVKRLNKKNPLHVGFFLYKVYFLTT